MTTAQAMDERVERCACETLTELMHVLQNQLCKEILLCLVQAPRDVSTISQLLELDQSAISHCLATLLKADLTSVTKVGKRHIYCMSSCVGVRAAGDARVQLRIMCRNGEELMFTTTLPTYIPALARPPL